MISPECVVHQAGRNGRVGNGCAADGGGRGATTSLSCLEARGTASGYWCTAHWSHKAPDTGCRYRWARISLGREYLGSKGNCTWLRGGNSCRSCILCHSSLFFQLLFSRGSPRAPTPSQAASLCSGDRRKKGVATFPSVVCDGTVRLQLSIQPGWNEQ